MAMKISECREVLYESRPVMRPILREVVRAQGLIESTLTLPVPSDAREGVYTVVTTVHSGGLSGRYLSNFFVRQ